MNESNTRTGQTFDVIKKYASSTSHNEYLDIILSEVALSLAVIADALMQQNEGSDPDVRG